MTELLQNSLSASTWVSYGKHWAEWLSFVPVGLGVDNVAAHNATLAFLSDLRKNGSSLSMAKKKLCGVAFMLKILGKEDVTKAFVIRQLLKGWNKVGVRRDLRRPVSFLLLSRLLTVLGDLCFDPYEVALFRCAFSLAFFGALRVSEFAAANTTTVAPLSASDVVLLADGARIYVARSKTDQYGQGIWLSIASIQHEFCPVRLLRLFLYVRQHSVSFLAHSNGSPVTRFQFTSIFKKCLLVLGLSPAEFGTHSFRIGAATVAEASGLPDDMVKKLGRWKSDCFRRYIRPNLLTC